MSPAPPEPPPEPDPSAWPVLVTGAGGFVGGHVARHLAAAGHPVRALVRRDPDTRAGDPPIEWIRGDLRDPGILADAVRGVRAVLHSAAWVSLGRDRRGTARAVNVDAVRRLLDAARGAGVERFVLTSTLHTLAAGTPDAPADEHAAWNLQAVDSAYARTKREAEALVRAASDGAFRTVTLCPGMVLGPRDPKPTSTALVRAMSRSPVAVLPGGGIPIVDARVLALAHRRALNRGTPGARYALVGPYLSYPRLARLVGELTGWPRRVVVLPDGCRRPLLAMTAVIDRLAPGLGLSPTLVAGGFLPLYVTGRATDTTFGLVHPEPIETLRATL